MDADQARQAIDETFTTLLARCAVETELAEYTPLVTTKGKAAIQGLKRAIHKGYGSNVEIPQNAQSRAPISRGDVGARSFVSVSRDVEPCEGGASLRAPDPDSSAPLQDELQDGDFGHVSYDPQSTNISLLDVVLQSGDVEPTKQSGVYEPATREAHIAWTRGAKCTWKGAYNLHVESLITQMLLNEYPGYETDPDRLSDRVQMIKSIIKHCYDHGMKFTVFPHRERFTLTYLKDAKNFQYYMLFTCLYNYYKDSFNLVVNTCGTKQILQIMNDSWEGDNIADLLSGVLDYYIHTLSVRITGDTVPVRDRGPLRMLFSKIPAHGIAMLQTRAKSAAKKDQDACQVFYDKFKEDHGRKPRLLVCIAYLETDNAWILQTMLDTVQKLKENNPLLDVSYAMENERIRKEQTDATPWSIVTRVRNRMLDKYILPHFEAEARAFAPDYVFWMDSDIVEFPTDFPTRAIALNPTGVTAPLTLIEGTQRFYDFCGYVQKSGSDVTGEFRARLRSNYVPGRNVLLVPPYFDRGVTAGSNMVEMDCVGCLYVVPMSIFDPQASNPYGGLKRNLLRLLPKHAAREVLDDKVRYADTFHFTDHMSICTAIRARGDFVYVDKTSVAYHADCPLYGMSWH